MKQFPNMNPMPQLFQDWKPSRNKNNFPPQIESLFDPREPVKFIPKRPEESVKGYTGVSDYLKLFEKKNKKPPKQLTLPRWKEKELKKRERISKHDKLLKIKLKEWDPNKDEKIVTDPYNTLFVCRLDYKTTEDTLRKEFEKYGNIKYVRIVKDVKTGKSKGYAFVEFERASDMKRAYRHSEHKVIDGRVVLVDAERARICYPKWKPRRLGGGFGTTRKDQMKKKDKERIERLNRRKKGRRVFGRRRGGFSGGGFRGGGKRRRRGGYGGGGFRSKRRRFN